MYDKVRVYQGKMRGAINAIPSKSHAHRLTKTGIQTARLFLSSGLDSEGGE